MQLKVQFLEFLCEKVYFCMCINIFSVVFCICYGIVYVVYKYYNDNGYFYMYIFIIMGSDVEGVGEMFWVINLDISNLLWMEEGEVDFKEDFFEKLINFMVFGQLQAEIGVLALGKVYIFGFIFCVENFNIFCYLAEFWMIELEVVFYDIFDNMDLVEDFCKYFINYILENYSVELEFLDQCIQNLEKNMFKNECCVMGFIEILWFVVDNDFEWIIYIDVVNILCNFKFYKKGKFEYDVEWGKDLQVEYECYLVEKKF